MSSSDAFDRLLGVDPASIRAAIKVLEARYSPDLTEIADDFTTKDIVMSGGKHCVVSRTTGRSFGCYDTHEAAVRRLRQIEAFKSITPPTEGILKFDHYVRPGSEEKRYTLAPVYSPNRLDAHDEYMTADDLEEAFWKFSLEGDRRLRLQHTGISAGVWVSIMAWPFEHNATLSLPTGEIRQVLLPPGTVYMGALWEQWAWSLVLKGLVRGFSLAGFANRLYVDFLPEADLPPELSF